MSERVRGGWSLPLRLSLSLVLCVVLTAGRPASWESGDPEHGVYVLLVEDADGSVEDVTVRLTESLVRHGWQVATTHDVGSPAECSYEARVVVVHSPGYAATIRPYGLRTAFAAPVRLVVFQDENGVHIGSLNLLNVNRTMVDELVPPSAWAPWQDRLSNAVWEAFPTEGPARDYGEVRDRGRIGKTMGIMAGGPFEEKIETVFSLPAVGTSVAAVADRLHQGLGAAPGSWAWELGSSYVIPLPEMGAAVVGVSGAPMERKAFDIVGAGGVDARKEMACPGLDHAAAFPIELVVVRVGDRIDIQAIDEMYRMKMYFEDAGKIAFARNMGMPGSIEDELRAKVQAVLR